MDDQRLVGIALALIIGLIALVWRNMSKRVDEKLDKELYNTTMIHVKKAVEGINGTAQTLQTLADNITEIQKGFLTKRDFQYALKIHQLECKKYMEEK
jgi:hypothetical protein